MNFSRTNSVKRHLCALLATTCLLTGCRGSLVSELRSSPIEAPASNAFEQQLRREFIAEAETYFDLLSTCQEVHLVTSRPSMASTTPLHELAIAANETKRSWNQAPQVCINRIPRPPGSHQFRNLKHLALQLHGNAWYRRTLRLGLRLSSWVGSSTKQMVMNLLVSRVGSRLPFLKTDQGQQLALLILSDKRVRSSLITLLNTDRRDLKKLAFVAFEYLEPTRIRELHVAHNNLVFPFMPWLADNLYGNKQALECLAIADNKISEESWRKRDQETLPERYQRTLQLLDSLCPELSTEFKMGALAQTDLLDEWEASYSFKLSLQRQLRRGEIDHINLEPYRGAFSFLHKMRKHWFPIPIHHFATPSLLRYLMSKDERLKDVEESKHQALIFVIAAAYQFFDSEAKLRLHQDLSVDQLRIQIRSDMNLWWQAVIGVSPPWIIGVSPPTVPTGGQSGD